MFIFLKWLKLKKHSRQSGRKANNPGKKRTDFLFIKFEIVSLGIFWGIATVDAVTVLSSLLNLGVIMVGVIVGSKKTGINPDNVATPIAASFGDLITLAILAWISQGLFTCLGKCAFKCV